MKGSRQRSHLHRNTFAGARSAQSERPDRQRPIVSGANNHWAGRGQERTGRWRRSSWRALALSGEIKSETHTHCVRVCTAGACCTRANSSKPVPSRGSGSRRVRRSAAGDLGAAWRARGPRQFNITNCGRPRLWAKSAPSVTRRL